GRMLLLTAFGGCAVACGTSDESISPGAPPDGGSDATGGAAADVQNAEAPIPVDSAPGSDGSESGAADDATLADTGMSDHASTIDAGDVTAACAAFASANCAHYLACRPGLFRLD